MEQFPKQAFGSVIVGIACGSTSIVYTMEKLSRSLQISDSFHGGPGSLFSYRPLSGMDPPAVKLELAAFFAVGILSFYRDMGALLSL